jgi:hypothetical protein
VPRIFSYGSLQKESVQLATYGRVLHGDPDELSDWVRTSIDVPKSHKAAAAGITHYANVERAPGSGSRVAGIVFDLTDAELAAADAYELDADYVRVLADLGSGQSAWVYVSR